MDKEVVIEGTKKVFGVLWVIVKCVFKGIWWILKNFKFQSTSLYK